MDGASSSMIAKIFALYELSDADLPLPENCPTREDVYCPSKIYSTVEAKDETTDDDIGRTSHLMKFEPAISEKPDRGHILKKKSGTNFTQRARLSPMDWETESEGEYHLPNYDEDSMPERDCVYTVETPGKEPVKPVRLKTGVSAAAANVDPNLSALSLPKKDTRKWLCFGAKDSTSRRSNQKDTGASADLGIKEPNATGVSVKKRKGKKVAGVQERRAVEEKSAQVCESKEPKAAAEGASSTLVVIKREGCRVCGDDDRHIFGCPYEDYVPLGATVCPGYFVICRLCGRDLEQPVVACWMCGKRGGRAMAKACSNCHTSFDHMAGDCPLWMGDRNPANSPEYKADPVMYTEEPVMAELKMGDRNTANIPDYKADPVMYTEEPVMGEYIEPLIVEAS